MKPINRFGSLSLSNHQSKHEFHVQLIEESLQQALVEEWQSKKLEFKTSERFDLLLEWGRRNLEGVTLIDQPYTNLYDLLRVKAAISFSSEQGGSSGEGESADVDGIKLVMGDLSGIQSYLFSIAHIGKGGVAKRLRARSFHLSLMSKTAAMYILDSLGLSYRHILMTAGGVFLLAVRPTDDLSSIRSELDRELYHQYHGALQLHLASELLTEEYLDSVSAVTAKLHSLIQISKQRPLNRYVQSDNGWNNEIWIHRREPGEYCRSCGRHPVTHSNSSTELCHDCQNDERIGQLLTRSNSVWIGRKQDQTSTNSVGCLWGRYEVRLLPQRDALPEEISQSGYWERWNVPAGSELPAAITEWVQTAFVSNYIPHRNNVPLSFEDLAQLSDGKKVLGVYKADIDKLGLLFSFGLRGGRTDYSLSEYITASRRLEMFFGEKLTFSLRKLYPQMYTVFSGGDDLFLIGPWTELPEFALWLKEEFARFVDGNPEVTLSASLVLVSPRTPLATIAHEAEEGLEAAKEQPNPLRIQPSQSAKEIEGRNQVMIADTVMEWSDLQTVWERTKQWAIWEKERICSHQFFRKLMELAQMRETYVRDGIVEGLRYNALLHYSISRLIEENKYKPYSEPRSQLIQWANSLKQLNDPQANRDWYIMSAVYKLFSNYRMEGERQ